MVTQLNLKTANYVILWAGNGVRGRGHKFVKGEGFANNRNFIDYSSDDALSNNGKTRKYNGNMSVSSVSLRYSC